MANPRLSLKKHKLIHALGAEGRTRAAIAKEARVATGTVSNFLRRPLPIDAKGAEIPEPVALRDSSAFKIDTQGWWLNLSDAHIPYHDRLVLELAVAEAKKRKVVGIFFNGDLLDSHEVSNHDKNPKAPRYVDEIGCGRQFLGWVRRQFPKARVILKEGNHEERLMRYIMSRAPALFGLEGVTVPDLLHVADLGIEWVGDRRVVEQGRLNVIHGHEYRGGVSTPVNPARGLYLKARSVAMCGHWHRTSEHHERNIRGKAEAAWSVGCACDMNPQYAPLNNWNHGFAFVHVGRGGEFEVENKRVFAGRVV